MKRGIVVCLGLFVTAVVTYISVFAQSQTHVVRVNADGTFSPQILYIKSGDTVRWEGLGRTDSIIPADGSQPYPALCTSRKAYNPADPNEFTGPLPFAPSGFYVLNQSERGYIETSGTCPNNEPPVATGDNGKVLCRGGVYQSMLDSTWRSSDVTGIFIQLLWSDVNPKAGVYDFTILQREIDKAVQNGKLYSLAIKAGHAGTPDWIFSTEADNAARAGGGGGVPRLRLQDKGDAGNITGCGVRMDLGNPANSTFKQHYFAMLTETARFIKTRADWYRALAYIKFAGANLFSNENRLPKSCDEGCTCNPAILAGDGYRPSGLYAFYDEQAKLMRDLFPGKAMNYMLIQDGFPRINETGGYLNSSGGSSNSSPLPGAFEQTQTVIDRGQLSFGLNFTVAHNGLTRKGAGCPFDGVHPKPVRSNLNDYEGPPGSNCPNRWAVREGAEGQITGYQTTAPSEEGRGIVNAADLDQSFQNLWDNTDGIYLETFESTFWLAQNTGAGILPTTRKTVGAWVEDLHRRRNDSIFPNFVSANNPFPTTHSFTFRNPGATPQYLYYVHGMKCGAGKQEWGVIVIDANPFTTPDRGGATLTTSGSSAAVTAGYGRIVPDAGRTTPAGVAIFGYRTGGVLVSEVGVPATATLRSGRIHAEVNGPLNTGLAIANPNEQTANINFHFTDAAGVDVGFGSTTIAPNRQIATFLNEAPFKTFSGSTFQGAFSFTSDVPVGVIALRGLLNQRQEFLMSTLPVLDTSGAPVTGPIIVPHFSDGGGWTTEILLVNPTSTTLNGSVEFRSSSGAAANVTIGGQTASTFAYLVPARSSQKLATSGAVAAITSGSVRVLPSSGGASPVPLAVFSYKPAGITLSEAGVGAAGGTAFRMYVESSGTPGQTGNIQSGIAIANNTSAQAAVTLELTHLDGTSAGLPAPVVQTLPASGHSGQFLAQFFPTLPASFKGILRVSTTSAGVAVVGLRGRYNERRDFLITTTPPASETAPASSAERLFPQLADGGGYTTQFILFNGTAGSSSSGSLILVQQSGYPFVQTLTGGSR